jgi:putative NADH-flavin reductase
VAVICADLWLLFRFSHPDYNGKCIGKDSKKMKTRTDVHAGQNGVIDPAKLTAMLQELDCQISPFELLALANKHCKNITPAKISEILNMVGGF